MLLYFTYQSDFSFLFLGVEPFPVLLQVRFVYHAVVFDGRLFYLLAVGFFNFCPSKIWTQLLTLCWLFSFHLFSLTRAKCRKFWKENKIIVMKHLYIDFSKYCYLIVILAKSYGQLRCLFFSVGF